MNYYTSLLNESVLLPTLRRVHGTLEDQVATTVRGVRDEIRIEAIARAVSLIQPRLDSVYAAELAVLQQKQAFNRVCITEGWYGIMLENDEDLRWNTAPEAQAHACAARTDANGM